MAEQKGPIGTPTIIIGEVDRQRSVVSNKMHAVLVEMGNSKSNKTWLGFICCELI